ncbi:Organic cation transporter protein [Orchesella cincta]|uniref:Organic cation transporter protein n=1 Tax=Orchesella cincta TaxID=48709 RepID=A0A1D2NBC1_ORCCI|nr:Organic cation transporter protein [Orchesella cincta]
MHTDPLLEDLMGQLGEFGKYQLKQHILHLLTAFLAGMHMLSLTFVAPTPQHRCFIKEIDLYNSTALAESPVFNASILAEYIPLKQNGELDSCRKFSSPFDNSTSMSCNGQFVYDKSIYLQSRVYEWDTVCENKWQRALIQSIYVFGVFNGALIAGALSDRFGRKRILCISAIFQFVFAMVGAFIPNYILYCASLFAYGFFGSGGAYVTGFVLSMELVDKKKRTYCGTAFSASFATGVCFVALWSYLIRDVTVLQVVFALHALLLFGHFWLIDESIRWLWSQGRIQEAVKIARKAARTNGRSFNNNYDSKYNAAALKMQSEDSITYGLSDLFKTPNIRFRAINTAFQWFSIALCFYGLAFNTGALPGDPYLVFFLAGFADLPGHLLVVLVVDKTGRRPLNAAFLLIGGVACVVTTFIPRGLIVTSIAMIAKIAMAGCFAVIYNYTAELFPTVIRNSAVGLCSMAARMGGMLTPQITLLDSLDKSIPTLVFGGVAIFAAFMGLFLPETLHKEMPQSLEDGENFGKGDTAFTSCCGGSNRSYGIDDLEQGQRLKK